MRRYTIEVGGKVHTVDVQETAADRFQVHIGGRALEVRLAAARDVAEAVISPEIAPQDPPQVPAGLRPVAPESLPPLRPAPLPALPPQGDPLEASSEVRAPMPGTVVSVEVAAGDHVEHGQPLLKLDAMKMTNTICAPRAGVVDEVHVAAGASVRTGQPLVTLVED
ncbi:MAG: biotin/lipoyl-binding protein [Vicinamibacteria bacterium]|nr:biotin/lipoyl-binding protein [Vicinamibacteria bacterium]